MLNVISLLIPPTIAADVAKFLFPKPPSVTLLAPTVLVLSPETKLPSIATLPVTVNPNDAELPAVNTCCKF